MKVIYVAGPYRSDTVFGVSRNIHEARELGALVAQAGAMPLIPHSNTAHFDGLCPDQFWLDGTMELLRRCDAAIFSPRWHLSSGSRAERAEAERLVLPRFDSIADLEFWLRGAQP